MFIGIGHSDWRKCTNSHIIRKWQEELSAARAKAPKRHKARFYSGDNLSRVLDKAPDWERPKW